MGIGFVKLRSCGQDFLVVNVVDSPGEDGKDLALGLCGEAVGGAGLAVIRHDGHREFRIECFRPDGSSLWRNENLLGSLVACAAHAVRNRYGISRPILIWRQRRLTAVVERDRVLVSSPDSREARAYGVTLLFQGEAMWPPAMSLPRTTDAGKRGT